MEDFIIDEKSLNQKIKKESSDFLSFEEGNNVLILQSKSGNLATHFIKSKGSLACKGEDCFYCKSGSQKRREIYYMAKLNDNEGILRLPLSVFLSIVKLVESGQYEGVENPRQAKWLVIKTGKGKETRYTVSFIKSIPENEEEVAKKTEELTKFLKRFWESLVKKYDSSLEIKDEEMEIENEEKVDPEDIPF